MSKALELLELVEAVVTSKKVKDIPNGAIYRTSKGKNVVRCAQGYTPDGNKCRKMTGQEIKMAKVSGFKRKKSLGASGAKKAAMKAVKHRKK